MGVHNLSEYVAYHQVKLRQEQTRTHSQSTSPPIPSRKAGVNPIRSKSSYDTSIINAPQGQLVILDCFATWCGPCKTIAPVVVKFSEEFSNAAFYKVDVDEAPDVAQELGIRAMPTFVLFKNGEKVAEVVGANGQALKAAIEKNI